MISKAAFFTAFLVLVLAVLAFGFTGCSKLFGPSDEEAIAAIKENRYLKSGVGIFVLQSPVEILEKGSRNKDGSWPVKVKLSFSHTGNDGKVSPPVERTITFDLRKTKDSSGKAVWEADLARE